MTHLAFVYHIPFWVVDGQVWSAHAAIGRYVEALAMNFEHVTIVAPKPQIEDRPMYQLNSQNLEILEVPAYRNIQQFMVRFFQHFWILMRAAVSWDLVNMRVPTQTAIPAYLAIRLYRKPVFLVVVGELLVIGRLARYPRIKQLFVDCYAIFQDAWMRLMINNNLSFVNGEDLLRKFGRSHRNVFLTRSSTIYRKDIVSGDRDTCTQDLIKVFTACVVAPHKGISLIPEIVALLNEQGIRIYWYIAGQVEGNAGKAELHLTMEQAERLGVTDRLIFCGNLGWEEVQVQYRSSDIFVLPTYMEGIPRVLLEAQAAGLPVVTTAVGGIPFAVQAGQDALLVPPGDVQAMAQAIQLVIVDGDLRRSLIRNGVQSARKHSLESETCRMLKRVSDVLHVRVNMP